MSSPEPRQPILQIYYQRYLTNENSASFIKAVSQWYTTATLSRLAERGDRISRRAAILALGYIASYESNAVLGRAMHDEDRAVRLLAENGIRELWRRDGTSTQQKELAVIVRLCSAHQFDDSLRRADKLINEASHIAEAWNQRAIAYFQLARFRESANDCHQTLELNPYHFQAAIGMGHCYLEMEDAHAALECFRRALRLNPDLESVRSQVEYLERSLEK